MLRRKNGSLCWIGFGLGTDKNYVLDSQTGRVCFPFLPCHYQSEPSIYFYSQTEDLETLKNNLTSTYGKEVTTQDTTVPWVPNTTSSDLSYVSEGLSTTYDLTTSLVDSLSTQLSDILDSVTSIPSVTTVPEDAYTYTTQDHSVPSLGPSLAASLLTVLPFTK